MATGDSIKADIISAGLPAGIGGLFNIGSTILGNRANRKAQERQNAFNAEQARLNREFQSREAEIARDWQEEQYNKYSSPQAMVSQYRDAGLNPALMYGSNLQSGTGSSSSPSGSSASGSAIPMQIADLTGVIGNFLGLSKLKAEIDNINADSEQKRASAGKSFSDIEVNKQSIIESRQRVSKLIAETTNETEKRGLIVAQKLLAETQSQLNTSNVQSISYDILKKRFDEQFKQDYGLYPATSLYDSIWRVLQGIGESSIFKRLINFR